MSTVKLSPTLPEGFLVRGATKEEYFSIVREPQLWDKIVAGNEGKEPEYNAGYTYLITYRDYKLIFTLEEKAGGFYETHVACPRDSIRASRILILVGIQWFVTQSSTFTRDSAGVRGLITTCPEGKIANMCRKLGFKEMKRIEDKLYFILDLGERL